MNFVCQQNAIAELKSLSKYRRHSVLIEGPSGSGKTFLAKEYGHYLDIVDFQIVSPRVDDIRYCIDTCSEIANDIVICIENLDTGVRDASYALLKFLEEPSDNIYVVITCNSIHHVPDTIVSRSSIVSINAPAGADIDTYVNTLYQGRDLDVTKLRVWSAVRSFKDVDNLCKLSLDQLQYMSSAYDILCSADSVANIVWKLFHFADNQECLVSLMLQVCMVQTDIPFIRKLAVACLDELSLRRIAKHVIITQFVLQCKQILGGI